MVWGKVFHMTIVSQNYNKMIANLITNIKFNSTHNFLNYINLIHQKKFISSLMKNGFLHNLNQMILSTKRINNSFLNMINLCLIIS